MIEMIGNVIDWIVGNFLYTVVHHPKATGIVLFGLLAMGYAVLIYYAIEDYKDYKNWKEYISDILNEDSEDKKEKK